VVKFLIQHFGLKHILYDLKLYPEIAGLRTMPGLRQLPTLPSATA